MFLGLAAGSRGFPRGGESMKPTIVKRFSERPKLVGSNGHRVIWVPIPELETNITNLVQSYPDAQEEFFVKLLVNKWRQHSDPMALKLLSVYLRRLGYSVARRVHEKWEKFPPYAKLYEQQDLYQMVWLIASDPAEFLKNINLQYPPENYVNRKMEGKIKDEIFSNLAMGARSYSDWGLLWRKSRRSLRKELQNQGYQQLDRYLLAYDCFKEIYAPPPTGSGPLPPPQDQQFQDMADLYNLRVQSTEIAAPDRVVDGGMIKNWLTECIKVLRNSQTTPPALSIDAPSGRNEDSVPLSESEEVLGSASNPQWERLEIQEPAEQLMADLRDFLPQQRQDANKYLLLVLTCGLDLVCRSIAPIFGVHHSTVHHRYNSETQRLLKKVGELAQEQLGVTPDSEKYNEMRAPLKQWLNQYYQNLVFQSVFQSAWQQLDQQRRKLLHLRYLWEMNEAQISRKLQLPASEVSEGLLTGREELAIAIASWIEKDFNVPPAALQPLVEKIEISVQILIANANRPRF